jgi:hypothetical protein
MKFQTTRFALSVMGIVFLAALAFYAISQKDAVTPPLCVTGIGTIIGGYQWSRAVTTSKYIENNKSVTGG